MSPQFTALLPSLSASIVTSLMKSPMKLWLKLTHASSDLCTSKNKCHTEVIYSHAARFVKNGHHHITAVFESELLTELRTEHHRGIITNMHIYLYCTMWSIKVPHYQLIHSSSYFMWHQFFQFQLTAMSTSGQCFYHGTVCQQFIQTVMSPRSEMLRYVAHLPW